MNKQNPITFIFNAASIKTVYLSRSGPTYKRDKLTIQNEDCRTLKSTGTKRTESINQSDTIQTNGIPQSGIPLLYLRYVGLQNTQQDWIQWGHGVQTTKPVQRNRYTNFILKNIYLQQIHANK